MSNSLNHQWYKLQGIRGQNLRVEIVGSKVAKWVLLNIRAPLSASLPDRTIFLFCMDPLVAEPPRYT